MQHMVQKSASDIGTCCHEYCHKICHSNFHEYCHLNFHEYCHEPCHEYYHDYYHEYCHESCHEYCHKYCHESSQMELCLFFRCDSISTTQQCPLTISDFFDC